VDSERLTGRGGGEIKEDEYNLLYIITWVLGTATFLMCVCLCVCVCVCVCVSVSVCLCVYIRHIFYTLDMNSSQAVTCILWLSP